jgi:gluconolactonase
VVVFNPAGTRIGQVSVQGCDSVTNVAFGGPDHNILLITGMGGGTRKGVFRLQLTVPGKPY